MALLYSSTATCACFSTDFSSSVIFDGSTSGVGGATGAAFGATCFGSTFSLTACLAVDGGADTFGNGGVAKSAAAAFVDLADSFSLAEI